jgi:parvulin-like peptidyl-prolyl isomerase
MTRACRSRTKRYTRIVLGTGAAVGILLAAAGALVPTASDFSGSVVARVNGKAITSQDLDFALERLAGDSHSAATHEERLAALQRLIDQELLIQRGVEIELLDSDLTVRKAIAGAMIDAIVADVLAKEPSEEELHAFYESHKAVFTVPSRVHVQQIYCSGDGDLTKALSRAEQASAALAHGLSFQEARERYGDEDNVSLPNTLLPLNVLRRLLGPTLTDTVLAMKPGDISPPLQAPAGYHILRLVELQSEEVQPYEAVRQEVRAEYVRRGRDEALQHYLDGLRQKATIVRSPQAPG